MQPNAAKSAHMQPDGSKMVTFEAGVVGGGFRGIYLHWLQFGRFGGGEGPRGQCSHATRF